MGSPTQIADWATGARGATLHYDGLDHLESVGISGIADGTHTIHNALD